MQNTQEKNKPFDAGDEHQVKERKTKKQLKLEKQREELRQICKDKRVRDYLWRVLSECGIYSDGFDSTSPYKTSYNEGRRKIGIQIIIGLMDADPSIYSLMRLEAAQGED